MRNASIAWGSSRPRRSAARGAPSPAGRRAIARRFAFVSVSERRERLRADDEQRASPGSASRACRRAARRRRSRRSARAGRVAVVCRSAWSPSRCRVRAADADVHDVGERLARSAVMRPPCTPSTKSRILSRLGAHVRHHVLAVDEQSGGPSGCAARCAATARSSVVLMFSPANIAAIRCLQAARFGEREQQLDRLASSSWREKSNSRLARCATSCSSCAGRHQRANRSRRCAADGSCRQRARSQSPLRISGSCIGISLHL